MPIVDLIIAAGVIGAGVSGHRRGLAGAPVLSGFAAGALLGAARRSSTSTGTC